jgi:uncharacterized protein (TIGR02145 family)
MGLVLILTHSCKKDEEPTDKITDKDGNVYTSVAIGNQVWMVENLKTTKYNDGTPIPLLSDNSAWALNNIPGYCWYNNDEATFKSIYGAVYKWAAVNTNKLCPTGWHVPSYTEWETLITYLGGENVAGGKLKEAGTKHWKSPNTGASNESGFFALPNSYRDNAGPFSPVGETGGFWATGQHTVGASSGGGWYWDLYYDRANVINWYDPYLEQGRHVRCIKD